MMLCSKTPLDQCLCDRCENFEQLIKAMHAVGLRNVPSNRYAAIDTVVRNDRCAQFGSEFSFPKHTCIEESCVNCVNHVLEERIRTSNETQFNHNRTLTWCK